jgi:hypothetical protein
MKAKSKLGSILVAASEESTITSKKKPYSRPNLTRYGDLRLLTNGGTMCNFEDNSLGANTHF